MLAAHELDARVIHPLNTIGNEEAEAVSVS